MKIIKIAFAFLIGIGLACPAFTAQKDPNILLITIDTLRYDRVGVYSDKYVKTPHIDKLAAESIVFKRAFAHNPLTLPSHVNILTGSTPVFHGISDNPGFVLDQRFLTLAEYLKDKDYATAAFIGAFPLDSRFGLDQGFDVYDDNYGTQSLMELYYVERSAREVISPALEWIGKQDQKWFAWIHVFDPHEPYRPPFPFDQKYKDDPYSGEVAYVDSQLEFLFNFLEERGTMDNTLIVLTSDHGEALGDKGEKTHGYFAYNNTIHVPLIIRIPGVKNQIVEENVCHTDIFPTLCEALGGEIPSQIQGESLIPIIKGKKRVQKEIYFESLHPYLNRGWAPLTGFIKDDMKFIDQPLKEVYDIKQDILEETNLAKSSNLKELEKELDRLVLRLRGKELVQRFAKIDQYEMNKLKSLGYLSEGTVSRKKAFAVENDLKTLEPIENKVFDALDKYKKGRTQEAIKDGLEVIEVRPDFVLAYTLLANIYFVMGQHDNSIEILRKGLRNNPKNIGLLSKLGIMLVVVNRTEEAIDILQRCINKDDKNPEYFNYLGVAYQKNENLPLALENYKRAITLDSNFALPWNNMGSLYMTEFVRSRNEKDLQRALDCFNTALAFDPNLIAAVNGKNAALRFMEKLEERNRDRVPCLFANDLGL